ncbi:hypothetical protein DFR47_103462 [Pseudochrobactrum asaccharolyticum]|uniref:Uncharacterized protein n=1 Tax=Pseudochrobactrum asaccharolyticum TaxID=354351 RepID=A0A366E3A9_9HYPH|nr:hypothetical protein DFR47_103462 [Pseudochrobactrum asaccharolyticum]
MQKTSNQFAMLVVINLGLLALGAYISGGSFLSLFNLQSMAVQKARWRSALLLSVWHL